MKDQLVRAMTKDGFVNAVAVTTTGIVERARQIHKTLPTATAALGRLLTAASMMGNMQKVDDGSITLQLKGGGPLGRLLAVSDAEGNVRGWVENPQISMLEKAPGKLDVGAAVGSDGTLTVIRDLRMKERPCLRRDRRGYHRLLRPERADPHRLRPWRARRQGPVRDRRGRLYHPAPARRAGRYH